MKTIEVIGNSPFPWDMLRYDQAWPADGDAVAAFEQLAEEGSRPRERMTVRLRCESGPTVARWSSFLWGCKVVEFGEE